MIRLGRISYVNMAPVFHRLTHEVEEISGVPTTLNRMLLDGEIDVAPISSIEYARNAPRLRLLPRLCVSSEGAVDSIQLVTRMSLGRIRTVAVTPESATSVVLTKVLIPQAELLPLEGALVRVAATGALERSLAVAVDYAGRARASVDGSARREQLQSLADAVVERNR